MAEGWVGGKKSQVEIWTEKYRITGAVYTPIGAGHTWRFSDIVNKQDRPFLSLTDVTIYTLSGENVLWQGDFMALNKLSIVLITLLMDSECQGRS